MTRPPRRRLRPSAYHGVEARPPPERRGSWPSILPSTPPLSSSATSRRRPRACSPPGPTPPVKARWFVGPDEWTKGAYQLDFRVGGRERISGGPPGGPVHTYEARYHDIVPDERIVVSYDMYADTTRISVSLGTVEFAPTDAGTRLTYTEQGVYLDGADQPAAREHGTRALFDNLAAELQRAPTDALPVGARFGDRDGAAAEVRALIERRVSAVHARDADGAMADVAPDVLSFDVVNPMQLVGLDTLKERAADLVLDLRGTDRLRVARSHHRRRGRRGLRPQPEPLQRQSRERRRAQHVGALDILFPPRRRPLAARPRAQLGAIGWGHWPGVRRPGTLGRHFDCQTSTVG